MSARRNQVSLSLKRCCELLAREFLAGVPVPVADVIEDAVTAAAASAVIRRAVAAPRGTISGPTMMALTYFAMYVAILASVGPWPLASRPISTSIFPAQAGAARPARLR